VRIIRPALVVACAALLALALAASRAQAAPRPAAGLRVVASFNPAQGQNPENLVVAPDGTVYVTWLFAHAVVAVRPDGSQMTVPLPPGEATGIAIDPVADGRLTVGLISADPQAAGIWTVPLTAFAGHGAPSRLAALPAAAFPNGLAYAPDGTLYVADSARGLILKVPAGNSAAVTWLSSSLLTPTGAAFDGVTLPGVNGLKVSRGRVYATNTARNLLLRIPITAHGPAEPEIIRTGLAFDDFIITRSGTVIAAVNISDEVVRFTGNGPVTVIADKAHQGVENPSAVAFGPGRRLFITSAAYFGSHPALQVTRKPLEP
jgi:sugar lactone lactonase YvrE